MGLLFQGVTTAAKDLKCNIFLEIGMQPHLARHVEDSLKAAGAAASVVSTLRKGKPDISRVLQVKAVFDRTRRLPWSSFTNERSGE